VRDAFDHAGLAEGRVLIGSPLDEVDDEHTQLGQVVDDPGTDAGLGRGERVQVLGVPVDAEQVAVAAEPAYDVVPRRGGHVQVLVGQPAWQLHHRAREAPQDRDTVQQGLQLVVGGRHPLSR
jgi:hypothetical protein